MATATYIPIATQTLGSAAASITFSSIPGTYTDLRLVVTCTTSAGDTVALQFNSDTGNNYSNTELRGQGTTAISGNEVTNNWIDFNSSTATSTTVPQLTIIEIFSYAGSTNKALLGSEASDLNGSGTVQVTTGLWRNTSAITSIKLLLESSSNFSTGTIATLWGI